MSGIIKSGSENSHILVAWFNTNFLEREEQKLKQRYK